MIAAAPATLQRPRGPIQEQFWSQFLTATHSSTISPDSAAGIVPNTQADAHLEKPFVTLLTQLIDKNQILKIYRVPPDRSCIREPRSKTKTSGTKSVRFDPAFLDPTPTGRRYKQYIPKELAERKGRHWIFPKEDWDWMRRRSRAHIQVAHDIASDLEDDVWFSWRDWEYGDTGNAASARIVRNSHFVSLGSMRFIIDTGCGFNLIAARYVEDAHAMGKIKRLPNPIALNTAGGLSKALGTVSVACPQMPGGSFECLVMPETPSVISVGERCLDHGYSFHWPAGKTPYLLLPNGRRVNLIVDGKIPYLTLEGRQAMGQVDVAVARGAPALPRWACVFSCAEKFVESPGTLGGPPDGTIQIRTTLDLHTQEVLAEHKFSGGIMVDDANAAVNNPDMSPFHEGPRDTLTYFYYSPDAAAAAGYSQ